MLTEGTVKITKEENPFPERYIAFMDVLGFTNIVFSSDKKRIDTYLHLIRHWKSNIEAANSGVMKKHFDLVVLSDSIILSVDKNEKALEFLLYACNRIQSNFLENNLFLRGAISFGECHYDEDTNIMLGKGLISAYHLEREAKFPRIIIDPRIISNLGITKQDFIEKYKYTKGEQPVKLVHHYYTTPYQDEPTDVIFVDYIDRCIHKYLTSKMEGNLEHVYNFVYDAIYSSQSNYEKISWLKDYIIDSLDDYRSKPQKDYVNKADWQIKKLIAIEEKFKAL